VIPLPYKLLAVLVLLAGTFGAGWVGHVRYRAAVDAKDAFALSEANRESERLAARNMQRITDELTSKRLAAERAGADLRERLRKQSEAGASSAAIAACRSDETATAARVLPDDVGSDLAALMGEAEAVADRLRACQAAQ